MKKRVTLEQGDKKKIYREDGFQYKSYKVREILNYGEPIAVELV